MRVLISGGSKTKNIVDGLEKKFKSGGIEFVIVPFIEDIENIYSRGEYFDRALIIDQCVNDDYNETNELVIRRRINDFANNQSRRKNKDTSFVFLSQSVELAEIIHEEIMMIQSSSIIVVKAPKFSVLFFASLVTCDFDSFPEEIVYRPQSLIGEEVLEVNEEEVGETSSQLEQAYKAKYVSNIEDELFSDIGVRDLDDLEEGIGELEEDLEGLGVLTEEDLEDIEDIEELEDLEDIEDIEEDLEELEDLEDVEDIEDDLEDIEDIEDLEDLEDIEDDLEDLEDIEDLGVLEDIEDDLEDLEDDLEDLGVLTKEDLELLSGDGVNDFDIFDTSIVGGIEESTSSIENQVDNFEEFEENFEEFEEFEEFEDNFEDKEDNFEDKENIADMFKDEQYDRNINAKVKSRRQKSGKVGQASIDVDTLRNIINPIASRGNSIVVTGCGGCGTSLTAYNIANTIVNLGYTCLLVDMDTDNRAQSYISKNNYDSMDYDSYSLISAVNSTADISAYVAITKPGFHLLSLGLASDYKPITEMLRANRLTRFHNSAKSNYNFVVYDVPFNTATDFAQELTIMADNIVLNIDSSNWGITKTMLSVCNIDSEDMMDTIFSRSQIMFNRYRGLNKVFGKKIKSAHDIIRLMDSKVTELIGEDPEYYFEEMIVCGVINDDVCVEESWYNNVAYSDSPQGNAIFMELLYNILTRNDI